MTRSASAATLPAWSGALSAGDWANIGAITHRGFTFHEALDNVDLVHINGRVYDPNLGRFISADPFIQAPLMSQSLNRLHIPADGDQGFHGNVITDSSTS